MPSYVITITIEMLKKNNILLLARYSCQDTLLPIGSAYEHSLYVTVTAFLISKNADM